MIRKTAILFSIILTGIIINATAQYPDTLWMPVTFYDYQTHPHAQNPDFEACLGAHAGMIHDTLSSLGKPLLLKDYGCNDHVEEWYWPSGIGQAAVYNFVTHQYTSGVVARPFPNEYVGVGYDSTYNMSNIVIYDSLAFIHIGSGLYEYKNDNYFPLDGRGYGEEGRTHNYGFAMELHTTFRHKPGLTFYFMGDDDAWAFIDGHLEMDLGGIHKTQAAVGSFTADTLGLTPGQSYDFDFFYTERHTKSSKIWITTNLISTNICTEVTIEAIPPVAIIPAGDSIMYLGTVWYDSTGADGILHHLPDSILSGFITWSFVSDNPLSNPANSSLTTSLGSQTTFTSTEAYETFTITASYEDPITGEITTATALVTITAGPPDHLVIEADADTTSLAKKQNDQPMDTLVIAANISSNNTYAILRDQWGNFSNFSQHTAWQILSGTVLASATVGTAALGEGIITKHGPSGIGTISGKDLDSTGLSYVDTCVVKVLNEPPVANNDVYTTPEDVTLVVPGPGKPDVLENDVDPDPNAVLTAELVTDVAVGVLNFNSDGSFTYVPQLNFNGNVQFTYKAYDGEFYSNVATVTIIVGVENDPPVANDDSYATNEDITLTIAASGVLTNDNDIDIDPLTAQLVATVPPLTGTLTLNADGSFTYVPALNFNGITTFTYQANDGIVNSNVATVTITVNPINDAPVALNDNYSVNEDATLTVGAPGILFNDYDVDGDPITAAMVDSVSNGTLILNANGSFIYTPNADFNGTDSFTYQASDGTASSNIATVTITVVPVNDVPIAVNDVYTTNEDVTLNVAAPGVLSNDSDVDGDPLTAVLITDINPAHGTLTFNANGSFTYVPTQNFNGTAIFTYQATDGTGNSGNATVMIFVNPVNDAPVANDDAYATDQNVTLNIAAPGVLANDVDIDGDALVAELVTGINPLVEGLLTFNPNGSFEYVPVNNYVGTFTFTYKAQDDTLYSNIATVTIFVGATNEAPVAIDDNYTTMENVTLNIAAPGILFNDNDPDLDALTAVLVSGIQVFEGTLTLNADGSFTYVPTPSFNGVVTFTYQASDGSLTSNVATVTITVTPANDVPIANNDNYVTDEDVPLNVPGSGQPGVLVNDIDIDGDPLSAILVTTVDPAKGTLALSANGSFVYLPALNFNGTATFTYKATDGTGTSAAATVTIVVNPINDGPVVSDIPDQTIFKGSTFQSFDLDSYVSDVDNTDADITWTSAGGVKLSIAIDAATHVVTITILDTSWVGSETITFTATDPGSLSASDNATFTILANVRLPMPETDTIPGTYVGNSLTMNLYVPNYPAADILYTSTTDGTMPPDPKAGTPLTINGTGLVSFGPFATDSTPVKVLAYSSQAPYEDSENRLFEYLVVYPQLPDPVANPGAGQYDTTGLTVTLSVPGHADATIYYTLDGTDPATSATKILYNPAVPIVLGPYTQTAYATIKAHATKSYYKPSSATFEYIFNPLGLPKPVADPPGHTFHTDSIQVRLYVPGFPDIDIRYTTDGTMPNVNSDLYTALITINKNTTLKAIAVKDGMSGPVMTEIYIQSLPTSLKLFPDTITTTPYPATTTCNAGILFPLVAKIFDQCDTCLTQYLTTGAPITWQIQEITGTNTGTLTTDSGYSNGFLPVKAHNTVKIIATFSENGKVFSGEIILIINPGEGYRLWLEADWDWHVSPNTPNPVDTIRLSTSKPSEEVYAIVRDSIGNWAAASKKTTWDPAINTIATVASGKPDLGEGIITKGSVNGTAIVWGENTDLNLAYPCDSTVVVVMSYWYDSLRIVVNNAITFPIDSLVMNTNQDSILYVFGHRDDGAIPAWEEVSAKWELVDKSLEYIIAAPPASAHNYQLSPVDTATGRIRVTLDDDAIVAPDTVWVKFTPGGPMRVEFELLTPDSLCIAGDTLTTVVRLYNGDNKLVYGTWSYPGNGLDSAMYDDVIGKADRPDPLFVVNGSGYTLFDAGSFAHQTFINGLDTVDFVLYYAPYDEDSLHQLTVTLDYTLKASTRPFRLLAAKLDAIDIVVDNMTPDTVYMYYNSGKMIKVIGYDTFGNIIEVVICNWTTSGDIPSILYPDSTKQIYYTVGNITYTTSGYITATSILDSTIQDSVLLIIGPRPATLVKALTQDLTGNGYLDAVKLFFDKKFIFPTNTLVDDLLTLYYIINGDTVEIFIDSLVQSYDSIGADSVFTAYYEEYDSGNKPQTDWLPYITITGISDITTVNSRRCSDGAPAVVWRVLKTANSSGNTTQDRIAVTLSESIVNTDGSAFMYAGISPASIFNVWEKTNNGFVHIKNMLTGIQNFTDHSGDTLIFYMTNGNNIHTNHYFNLVYQDSLLADIAYNTPAENNQKVRVQVIGAIDNIVIGPNPIIPTFIFHNQLKDQPLIHVDPDIVFNWITNNGGCMIVVDIELSTEDLLNGNIKITGQLMVFDAIGNLVYAKENRDNVLPDNWVIPNVDPSKETGTIQLVFYWDGITDRDMKAAPGLYRTSLYVKFGKDSRKLIGKLAVGR